MPSAIARITERGLQDLVASIAREHGITVDDMLTSRSAPAPLARAVLYRYLQERLGYSTVSIGKLIGRDHSTVVVALQRLPRLPRVRVAS